MEIVSFWFNYLFPGWSQSFYLFKNVSAELIFGITQDDLIWYILTGSIGNIILEDSYRGKLD